MSAPTICFVSSVVYTRPLDPTSSRKFETLRDLGPLVVVGLSTNLRAHAFDQHARFLLLPRLPGFALRYLMLYSAGVLLLAALVLRARSAVLVAQSPYEGGAAALARSLAGLLGRRAALVVESHGDFEAAPFLQRPTRSTAIWRAIVRWTSRFALSRAHALRAVSDATARQLRAWAPAKPIVQFPAWTDIRPFLAAGRERAADAGGGLVLYAGVLTPLKGVHHLIEAFAEAAAVVRSARLALVGAAPDEHYRQRLLRRVTELRLDGRVEFVPALPQAELAGWMARATVLVLPSLSEGLGRVLFEAMACGTPVIASAVGGTSEVVRDGENGFLVPAGEPAALAGRLIGLLERPEEAERMGRAGHVFAEQFFSPEKYLQGYRTVTDLAARAAGLGPVPR